MDSHEAFMHLAIQAALDNVGAPFGAVLVDTRNGGVVATGCNHTAEGPIWHGEMDAIHHAAALLDQADWPRMRLYTTAEPCCMCHGAILWAGIGSVVYGTSIGTLIRLGWRQIDISATELTKRATAAECEVIGGILERECDQLFDAARSTTDQ